MALQEGWGEWLTLPGLFGLKFWLFLFLVIFSHQQSRSKGYPNHCVSCSLLLTWLDELGGKKQEAQCFGRPSLQGLDLGASFCPT